METNPEVDSAYYLEILVESLGLLGKFKEAIAVNLQDAKRKKEKRKKMLFGVGSKVAMMADQTLAFLLVVDYTPARSPRDNSIDGQDN